jgi:hypothetical protein
MKCICMKYVVILFFFQATAFSGIMLAADFDTSKVLLNAKMNIVPFNRLFVDSAFIAKVIPAKCNFTFLKSNGFDGMAFFEIEINFDSIDQFSQIMTRNISVYDYTYYFGYRIIDEEFLLLKGFEKNDFRKLYNWAKTTTPLPEDFETKQGFCDAPLFGASLFDLCL